MVFIFKKNTFGVFMRGVYKSSFKGIEKT